MKDNSENNFQEWYRKVNRYIETNYGLSADDLPDFCYRDYFENGDTPAQAARAAIRAAKE